MSSKDMFEVASIPVAVKIDKKTMIGTIAISVAISILILTQF